MTNSLRPILAPLLLSLLALPGCDEAPLDVEDAELRSFIKVVYQVPASKSFKVDILPPDGDPGNDGDGGGGPPQFKNVLRNAPAIFAAAYQDSQAAEDFCPSACKGIDLEWLGEVTAQAELEAEDSKWMMDEKTGEIFAETLVKGEVAMGCACE